MKRSRFRVVCWICACGVLLGAASRVSTAESAPTPPDLTAGGVLDVVAEKNVMEGVKGAGFLWQGETTLARQMLVTRIAPASPWTGLLQPGDVILGVGGKKFESDARLALVESRQKGEVTGTIELVRWRSGQTEAVTLKLVNPPDFTQGGQPDASHDWTLGPTGARGWIYSRKGHSADARQILVTAVAAGSPADGVLQADDVILGVAGKPFDGDARIQFAKAITVAEEKSGALRLVRWRGGQTQNVELKLPVLGTHSDTAPYACPKSRKIFEQGCRAIAQRGCKGVSIPNSLNALALLASGKAEYRPLLADYAKQVAEFSAESMATWHYGYANMFLAEYVMATGDKSVLPGVKRLALEAARGQSGVGTWGHKFARPDGNLNGYGCMNQPGLTLMISMVLARQAGVEDPALDRAIAKGAGFLRWYVSKGSIPYGDHQAGASHENNGMCASSAILFDLLGDREAATFFAKMTTAAYSERERGHTGNYFNLLWAVPGVSRCGPLAVGAYLKEQAWYYDLARGWDGSFAYQGSPVGAEEHGKYTEWDSTGAYLLAYALPLKSLFITGKQPSSVPVLNRPQVAIVIEAGRDFFPVGGKNGYEERPTKALMDGLTSWSPAVRNRSAEALARREGDFVPALLLMLAGKDRDTRYGAVEALGALGSRADAAEPPLRAALHEADPWLQSLACKALMNLGEQARQASVADLLAMIVRSNPADPREMAQRAAGIALFANYPGTRTVPILKDSLADVDHEALRLAIVSLLQNDDSVARGSVARLYGKLCDRELAALLPDIVKATERLAPSGEMFADGIRLAGLDLLSHRHIREGMALCVLVMEPDRWGAGHRVAKCAEYLGRYGAHAQAFLPQLEEMRSKSGKSDAGLDALVAAIQSATNAPPLVDLEGFIAQAQTAASTP